MGRKFANTAKPVRRIIYSDHARCIFEVVFGGVEKQPVRREKPMTKEMPASGAGYGQRLVAFRMIENDCEGAGSACEHNRAPGDGVEGDVMAPLGQISGKHHAAIFG